MSSNNTTNTPKTNTSDVDPNEDLTVFVQSLLEQMQSRFSHMSEAIIGRIDEMGTRIDDLEKSIGELMDQTNDDDKMEKTDSKASEQAEK